MNPLQNDDAWKISRLGVCTASRFADILPGPRGYKKARENYKYELIAERLTGEAKEFRATAEVLHGQEYESEAIRAYEFITGLTVVESDMSLLDGHDFIGASPDGLILPDGGVEIKCFDTKRHVEILLNGMPKEIMAQVQGNIWIHKLKWLDFISYDPRIKTDKNIYIQRIERDEKFIEVLSEECLKFINEINETMEKL